MHLKHFFSQCNKAMKSISLGRKSSAKYELVFNVGPVPGMGKKFFLNKFVIGL
jgi:hypothetical protein